ncbi:MAG: flagellar hook-length control protein FliK, partial [Deltaproteobacteria bacterium]|nr:flagellar hook-length control protein FliK [Deltaproteobacteria bacterium]
SGRAAGRAGEGELRADADKGGGGGGQKNNDSKDGAGAAPAGFRFNPALMAPVPVAQKRDLAGSDRLRRIANEIAQKIVERVRVGTNRAGASEFQIDLRQDVLSGLSIKVSSRHGRISMVFAGRDGDTLKQLEAQADGLKEALSQRGLQLEQMKFERTA